ncbi:MAG: hypothetical protein Q4P36_01875 [Bowdeniella nasicola]|nr:hypothetical protein [Bowdeniella nasicola]
MPTGTRRLTTVAASAILALALAACGSDNAVPNEAGAPVSPLPVVNAAYTRGTGRWGNTVCSIVSTLAALVILAVMILPIITVGVVDRINTHVFSGRMMTLPV